MSDQTKTALSTEEVISKFNERACMMGAYTSRPISDGAEDWLNEPQPVLDHGLVVLTDYMGSDYSIEEAARISYGAGTRKSSETQGLINYLICNAHTSPFEMAEVQFYMRMPVFIARQHLRHRTANVNEYSGRYSVMPNTFFVPNLDDIRRQSLVNKQGSADPLDAETAESVRDKILAHSQESYRLYEELLAAGDGVSREMARVVLPPNIYTEFYWKIDLHNLMHYINLRVDSHAQPQVQVYANALIRVIQDWVPMTYNAFVNYRQKAATLGESSVKAVAELIELGSESWDSIKDKYKLSKSEAADLETLFNF